MKFVIFNFSVFSKLIFVFLNNLVNLSILLGFEAAKLLEIAIYKTLFMRTKVRITNVSRFAIVRTCPISCVIISRYRRPVAVTASTALFLTNNDRPITQTFCTKKGHACVFSKPEMWYFSD